jgi:DNA-binding LytR/AlgR family response regulator
MNKGLNKLVNLLKRDTALFLYISFSVFLFVLFFQPFPITKFDLNNTLVFIAGIGFIIFIFMVLVRFLISIIVKNQKENEKDYTLPTYLGGFILFSLISTSLAFYIRYVGAVEITFYIMLRILLISIVPPTVLKLHATFSELKNQLEIIKQQKELAQQKIDDCEESITNKSIEFFSENNTDRLELKINDIAFVKSADNYVEIVYHDENQYKKKLLRNTLKNIEKQLHPYSIFIRSHRICIVNKQYIKKLNRSLNKYWLNIKEYDERIPVSRQYLLQFRKNN